MDHSKQPGSADRDWQREFADARTALFQDDVARARPVLEALEAAFPTDLNIRLHAAWARLRTDVNVTAARRREIETMARRAFARGDCVALSLCIAGHAALRRGELAGARRLFARAARADAALVDARRGLVLVQRRIDRAAAHPAVAALQALLMPFAALRPSARSDAAGRTAELPAR